MEKFLSPKFALALLTGILVVLNQGLGLHLPTDNILSVAAVVITYMFTEMRNANRLADLAHKITTHNASLEAAKAIAVIQNASTVKPVKAEELPATPVQQVIQDAPVPPAVG